MSLDGCDLDPQAQNSQFHLTGVLKPSSATSKCVGWVGNTVGDGVGVQTATCLASPPPSPWQPQNPQELDIYW